MRSLWPGIITLAANIALFLVIVWYGDQNKVIDLNEITALLTASAVVLTGTAVIIAILSWYGYMEVRERAENAARKRAEEVIREIAPSIVARTVEELIGEPEAGADEIAGAAGEDR